MEMRWCLMTLKSLCRFLIFWMCVLLLDARWLCGKGAINWSAFDENLAMQRQKDEQQSIYVVLFWLSNLGRLFKTCFLDLHFEFKYKKIRCAMYSSEAKNLSKGWFWWLIQGMMRSLEVSRVARISSQSVCLGWFISFCWLAFYERVPWLLGIPKNCNSPLKLRDESYKRGLWFFVRLLK
jgi:hypothetical protein